MYHRTETYIHLSEQLCGRHERQPQSLALCQHPLNTPNSAIPVSVFDFQNKQIALHRITVNFVLPKMHAPQACMHQTCDFWQESAVVA